MRVVQSILWCMLCYLSYVWHGVDNKAYAAEVTEVRGLFAVPGLGREDRVDTVVHNLRQLLAASTHPQQQQIITSSKVKVGLELRIVWDCVIYVYASRALQASFWTDKATELAFLSQHCTLIENPGKKVTENLYMIQPALMHRGYEYIFLLLDDIKIANRQEFDLAKIVEALHCNQLSVISPMVSHMLTFYFD